MAFKRKKIKDEKGNFITEPCICYICKEKKAFHVMNSGIICAKKEYRYRGETCCNDCYPTILELNNKLEERYSFNERNDEMSEGEYQAYGHLFD